MSFKEWAICLLGAGIIVSIGNLSCQVLAERMWEAAIEELDAEVP